jgi:type II secretory pathway pseudopilin PulG
MPTTHNDGLELAYQVSGEGPPLLIISGLSAERSFWALSRPLLTGFTLIECLAYLSLFGLFIVLVMTTFFHAREGSDALRRNADDVTRALHAGERWREDVRTATAPPGVAAG